MPQNSGNDCVDCCMQKIVHIPARYRHNKLIYNKICKFLFPETFADNFNRCQLR